MNSPALATQSVKTHQTNGLARFVTLLRWVTTALGLAWAALTPDEPLQLLAATGLVLYSLYRTWRPLDWEHSGWRQPVAVLIELAIALAAVVSTGTWTSTFIFSLFVPVVAAGFARGQAYALFIASIAAAVLQIFSVALGDPSGAREVITWTGELFLVAVVASYGRTLLSRAEKASALGELQALKLAQANSLLADLDRLAQDMSVSFDFQDAIRTSLARTRSEVPADACILLLSVEGTKSWDVAIAEGVALPSGIESSDLPAAALLAQTTGQLQRSDGPGFDRASTDNVYVPLLIAQRTIGMIAVERETENFSIAEQQTLERLARQIALTVDNARWFERLQARGAARERIRMARDLHDRLGQGVAYVAFELDRLSERSQHTSVVEDLSVLRDEARSTVRELRETLSDLRTDVSADTSLTEVITQFLSRVELRSGTEVAFISQAQDRINLGREQEVWRIAQEAITNAERHADASKITVSWTISNSLACLEVFDDGVGFISMQSSASSLGRASYGVTGMRERASLLGASLEISAVEPHGTRVQLKMSTNAYSLLRSADQQIDGNK